jgi:hypothetical protein
MSSAIQAEAAVAGTDSRRGAVGAQREECVNASAVLIGRLVLSLRMSGRGALEWVVERSDRDDVAGDVLQALRTIDGRVPLGAELPSRFPARWRG